MSILAVILVIISAYLHALKGYLSKRANNKLIFSWLFYSAALIIFAPVALYFYLKTSPSGADLLYWGVLSGIVHFSVAVFSVLSFENGDLSRVYPIMRSAPAVVAIIAVSCMGETLSLSGAAGIGLVVFGAYIVNMKHLHPSDILRPVRELPTNRGTLFAFLTMLSTACATIVDKSATNELNPWFYAYLLELSSVLLFTPYVLAKVTKEEIINEIKTDFKAIWLTGFIHLFGYGLIVYTFTFESVSYVVGLRQLSVVFAVILAGHKLKEGQLGIRSFASLLIVLGSILLVLDS